MKTRRERLIHNERKKLISNLCLGGAIAFLFVLAWELRGSAATLVGSGDLGSFIFLSSTLALVGLMSLCLFMVAWTSLDKIVDPDVDPEPDKPAATPQKRRAKRTKKQRLSMLK
jgi:hypothetical protein